MKKIAVILSGCGHKDGTEITEAVSLLIALYQNGASVEFFGLDQNRPAKNHITNQVSGADQRNLLTESARIARGKIRSITELKCKEFDGLAFPGGFGAAINLCTWGLKGAECEVDIAVKSVIEEFYKAKKPIAAICIAPVLLAKVLGHQKITITCGNIHEVAAEIRKTGAQHEECPIDDFVSDRDHKIITTPAYMYDEAKPHQVFAGISALAKELVEMA